MPRGPGGERRPADTVGCVVTVAKIATQEIEDPKEKLRQPAKARFGCAFSRSKIQINVGRPAKA